MLLETHRCGDRYVLLEVAPATGNRLLRFSSKDREMIDQRASENALAHSAAIEKMTIREGYTTSSIVAAAPPSE